MIDIIPNWHPIWVHFVIGLLIVGTLFYGLSCLGRDQSWSDTMLAAARWNILLGAGFALIAFITGFLAAGSVPHDDAAHANILVHRNWAFTAVVLFLVGGIAVWIQWRKAVRASLPVLALLLAGSVALAVTGFKGGQNVFEYGLGVRRLPDIGHHDHAHGIHSHHMEDEMPHDHSVAQPQAEEDSREHEHSHGAHSD